MKQSKLHLSLSGYILVLILVLLTANTYAFHEKGVASCSGCHSIHYSENGEAILPSENNHLLLYENSTELCLSCHATSNGSVLSLDPLNPSAENGGGDFSFLLEDNINDGDDGLTNPIMGNVAGHNVVSIANGISEDIDHLAAPGGSYLSANLTCSSCHDPHGKDTFRMLRTAGESDASGFTYVYQAPSAEGIALDGLESKSNHSAYRSGWSDWCRNCHSTIHNSNQLFEHPINEILDQSKINSYNMYEGPDNPGGGNFATAYIPEVPIEDVQITSTGTSGATSSSRLSCMSCHRAHATSAPKSTRWDPNVRFLQDDGVISGSFPIPEPYTGINQRPLCIKCHSNDIAANHGFGSPCLECHR